MNAILKAGTKYKVDGSDVVFCLDNDIPVVLVSLSESDKADDVNTYEVGGMLITVRNADEVYSL